MLLLALQVISLIGATVASYSYHCKFDNDCSLKRCAFGFVTDSAGCALRDCPCRIQPPVNELITCPICKKAPCPCLCPAVQCDKDCPSGWVTDADGCNTCQCKPDCQFSDDCNLKDCRFGPVRDSDNCPLKDCPCLPVFEPPVNKPTICPQCFTTPCPCECPKQRCEKDCPLGWKMENGCNTCDCLPVYQPPVLTPTVCPVCITAPCPCECPHQLCPKDCPDGWVSENGCNTCECKRVFKPPVNRPKFCPRCFRAPCPCECSHVVCDKDCPFGWVTQNGCNTCECRPALECQFEEDCAAVTCLAGVGFKRDKRGCVLKGCPCADVACPPLACNIDCPNGLKKVNGCDTCDCYVPPIVKPGQCLDNTVIQSLSVSRALDFCVSDLGCSGRHKCCSGLCAPPR